MNPWETLHLLAVFVVVVFYGLLAAGLLGLLIGRLT